jgi:hypothetical protein
LTAPQAARQSTFGEGLDGPGLVAQVSIPWATRAPADTAVVAAIVGNALEWLHWRLASIDRRSINGSMSPLGG